MTSILKLWHNLGTILNDAHPKMPEKPVESSIINPIVS